MTPVLSQRETGFTGGMLDRADHVRSDPEAFAALASDWRARLLALDGLEPRIGPDGSLAWSNLSERGDDDELILLGLADGKPHFAALASAPQVADPNSRSVWPIIESMPREDAAIYGAARSLIDWHGRHRFCARCGTATATFRAGWGRKCPNCKTEHFPRVDPVVIMLAEHEGKILVGRQPRFPPRRYSALAGFIEPGESIEEAVARELFEEAGVHATEVRYIASQPWPFPSSLMIACVATVTDSALTIDTTELEDAMWVTRDEVAAAMANEPDTKFLGPPRFAIAHSLFRAWLD